MSLPSQPVETTRRFRSSVLFCRFSSAKMSRTQLVYFAIRDQDQGRQQKADLTSGSTCHSDMQVVKFMVYHQITPLAEPESRQDPRSTWTVLRCQGGLHLTGYSRYTWLFSYFSRATQLVSLKWNAPRGFFPMTTSITRPWFMVVLICGGTVGALWLATGVLFRGIFPRLASTAMD